MRSVFTVTLPVTDISLLTLEELKAATGVTGSGQDAALALLGKRLSSALARMCGVASDGVHTPTLLAETCSEIYRIDHKTDRLRLARRPLIDVSSVVVNGSAVASSDYEFDRPSSFLFKACGHWRCDRVTISYRAGFAEVPEDLKLAATKLAVALYAESGRDPSLKRERVEGIGDREYWVAPSDDPFLTAEISDLIGPYCERWL